MLKALARHPAVQAAVARLIAWYLRFALGTARLTVDGSATLTRACADGQIVVGFWHEALPLMPALFREARRRNPTIVVTVLASRHRDGQLLGGIMRALGMNVAHGSTRRDGRERGGSASVMALLDVLTKGEAVAITPDGPRGPRRQAAQGVAQLAAISGAPVMPCGAFLRPSFRLGTWDRVILPLPFGRITLVCGDLMTVSRDDGAAALAAIEAAMTAAADRAEALCR
jgi:lysophospholipid acyltransferase (LPLAT)-like uncharacterized protein